MKARPCLLTIAGPFRAVLVDAEGRIEDLPRVKPRDERERHPYWRQLGSDRGPRK